MSRNPAHDLRRKVSCAQQLILCSCAFPMHAGELVQLSVFVFFVSARLVDSSWRLILDRPFRDSKHSHVSSVRESTFHTKLHAKSVAGMCWRCRWQWLHAGTTVVFDSWSRHLNVLQLDLHVATFLRHISNTGHNGSFAVPKKGLLDRFSLFEDGDEHAWKVPLWSSILSCPHHERFALVFALEEDLGDATGSTW